MVQSVSWSLQKLKIGMKAISNKCSMDNVPWIMLHGKKMCHAQLPCTTAMLTLLQFSHLSCMYQA